MDLSDGSLGLIQLHAIVNDLLEKVKVQPNVEI